MNRSKLNCVKDDKGQPFHYKPCLLGRVSWSLQLWILGLGAQNIFFLLRAVLSPTTLCKWYYIAGTVLGTISNITYVSVCALCSWMSKDSLILWG